MRNIKIKVFFARHRKIVSMICLAFCITFLTILSMKFNLISRIGGLSGNFVAVGGTLLGAVIGGVFTLIGSVYVNQRQLKAQTHIKRKNLIYKPLYDELCEIQNDILVGNPYPHRIVFWKEEQGWHRNPQYTVWGRIKSDTRFLETPQCLVEEVELLYQRINEYIKIRSGGTDFLTKIINDIMQETVNAQCKIINIGDSLIGDALKDSGRDIVEYLYYGLKNDGGISDDQREQINKKFYEACKENETIIKIQKAREAWDIQQKKVIELLTDLIQYVNIRYEG